MLLRDIIRVNLKKTKTTFKTLVSLLARVGFVAYNDVARFHIYIQ